MRKRSILAVVVGVVFVVVVTTLVDIALHMTGIYPPMNQPLNDSLALLQQAIASSSASPARGSLLGSRRTDP